jgi:hypothetical protein
MGKLGRKAVFVLVGAVYSPQESTFAVQKAKPRTTGASRRSVFVHGSPKIMQGNRYLHHRLLEPVYDLEARYGEGANKAIIGQSPVR